MAGRKSTKKTGRSAERAGKFTPAQRRELAAGFASSGMTKVAYAKKIGVSQNTLSVWLALKPAKAGKRTGRVTGGDGKFVKSAYEVLADDQKLFIEEPKLTAEDQVQRLRFAVKALARMI